MKHVGLSVDNLHPKFHEVLIINKKVFGPYIKKTNCLLETGSNRTVSSQREIPMALQFPIEAL